MKNRVLAFVFILLSCTAIIAGKPGEGISFGKFIIRPYVDLSITYDGNPNLAQTNYESDVFVEYELGANMLYKGHHIDFYGSIFWFARSYLDDNAPTADWLYAPDSLDHNGYGESFGLTYGSRDNLQIRAYQSFQQVTDYSRQPYSEAYISEYTQDSFVAEDRGNRLERDLINAGLAFGKDLTDKTELDLNGSFLRTDYAAPEMYDLDELTAHGEFAYKVTDKSAVFVLGEYSVQDTDALPSEPVSTIWRVGWKTKFTEKTAFKGSVGMEYYDAKIDIPDVDSQLDMPSYDLGWIWLPTDKLSFNVSGANTIEPSSYELLNVRKVWMFGGSTAYQFTKSFMSWAGISYRKDDYQREDANYGIVRKISAYGGKLGVRYAPPAKWYSLYVTASYEDTDSTIDVEDFDQFRLTGGVKLIY